MRVVTVLFNCLLECFDDLILVFNYVIVVISRCSLVPRSCFPLWDCMNWSLSDMTGFYLSTLSEPIRLRACPTPYDKHIYFDGMFAY